MDIRHKIFLTASAGVLLVTVLRMLFLASAAGESYRQEAMKTALHTGELSAIRGRIYDNNDQLLAWSERSCDLIYYAGRDSGNDFDAMCKALKKHFPPQLVDKIVSSRTSVIKFDLTANELAAADRLCNIYPALEIELRWERRIKYDHPQLGKVRQINGIERGISGWEAEFDDTLRGQPGKFSVMLDRRGRWIDSTFRITQPSRSGQDVYLSEESPEP